ncbi:uncharacterized protein WM277_012995 isoform 1-T1 [Molossus nigricans]
MGRRNNGSRLIDCTRLHVAEFDWFRGQDPSMTPSQLETFCSAKWPSFGVAGITIWIHHSRAKRATDPANSRRMDGDPDDQPPLLPTLKLKRKPGIDGGSEEWTIAQDGT